MSDPKAAATILAVLEQMRADPKFEELVIVLAVIVMQQIPLPEACMVRIEAQTESETISGGRLFIRKADDGEHNPMAKTDRLTGQPEQRHLCDEPSPGANCRLHRT